MKKSEQIDKIVDLIVECLKNGNKVLTFGVGGNAANAIHFAAELAGKFEEYENPLPCIDLCSNPSVTSAIATDFGWEHVFQRQIEALAKPGDVVVAFSISTKGLYLMNALHQALRSDCRLAIICGRCSLLTLSEVATVLELDSDDTTWVQEKQLETIHQICAKVKGGLMK